VQEYKRIMKAVLWDMVILNSLTKVLLLLKGSVEKALKENIPELKNRKLKVSKVKRNIERFNPLSIFVDNVGFNTTEMELGKFFEIYGDVKSVKMFEKRNNENIF